MKKTFIEVEMAQRPFAFIAGFIICVN